MNKKEYKDYLRSMKDNGSAHTIRHAKECHKNDLRRIDNCRIDWFYADLLAWRARWLSKPDTTTKNIIKLTQKVAA
jgi:hypothetical protein